MRLFPQARRLRLLVNALVASLPGLAAVAALLTLTLVVYRHASMRPRFHGFFRLLTRLFSRASVIGMALFGTHDPMLPVSAAAMPTAAADFTSFGAAMLTTFRLFTLDGWTSASLGCVSDLPLPPHAG